MGTINLQTTSTVVPGSGVGAFGSNPTKTFVTTLTGTGTCSCSVNIEVSADESTWLVLATISLSGTAPQSDGFVSFNQWAYFRANCTALSGTGATATTSIMI